MTASTQGLHHVTAIGGDPQRNVDFYVRAMGLRLVKRTVNFDQPGSYHLYYGDTEGRPGSLLTFFPWQGVPAGRVGAGQSTTTAFSVPAGSLGWWAEHLRAVGVASSISSTGSSEERLSLRDPDGLQIDLVASSVVDPREPWDSADVPAEHAIRGQHSSVLTVRDPAGTASVLTDDLGLRLVDVVADPGAQQGLTAGGTVHHVAFRVPDRARQQAWRYELVDRGHQVTQILDRQYFTSVYFREPGGVLFEIATDTPGFDIDEPLLELGRSLRLPPWLEPSRADIEAAVPPLHLPDEEAPAVVPAEPGAGSAA
jgi:glyoxalase family protein